jgi:hypothetical protein
MVDEVTREVLRGPGPTSRNTLVPCMNGLAEVARHVIGRHVTQYSRVQTCVDDVGRINICGGRYLAQPNLHGAPDAQGLTLVQFSDQLERFLWDRGCA